MRITYTEKDPRRGMTVEMDEDRARQLIAEGAARKWSDAPVVQVAPEPAVVYVKPAKKAKK